MKKLICKRTIKTILGGSMLMLLTPLAAKAQEAGAAEAIGSFSEGDLMMGLAIFLAAALVLAALGLLFATIALKGILTGAPLVQTETAEEFNGQSIWQQLKSKLVDAEPVELEEERMTDHEYDGIRELDNSLPPWWKALFYATIVFSVVYMAAYHLFGWGALQDEEYQQEVAEAKLEIEAYMAAKGGALTEENVEVVTDAALLSEGEQIFASNCAACHGTEMQGTVGPNLVDEYWLHGGSVGDIFKTIRDGVPSKGMISWKAQLSPEQIQNVSSFIISKAGSNPPNAKEPQGEIFQRK